VKGFTIEFKVKFDHFTNNQMLVTTGPTKTLEIQSLGNKIGAFIKTEAGHGGRGVVGDNAHGSKGDDPHGFFQDQLMSTALAEDTWYDVKFAKTPTGLSLTVTDSLGASHTDPVLGSSEINLQHIALTMDADKVTTYFDLKSGAANVRSGHMAGTDDIGLNGEIKDLTVVEGPAGGNSPSATSGVAAGHNGEAASGDGDGSR